MKKLMIAFAAVAVSAVANAGALNWQCYDIGTAYNGSLAYLVTSADSTLDNTAYLSALKGGTFAGAGESTTVVSGDIDTNVGSYSEETVYGYMILLNTADTKTYDQFKIADVLSATFGKNGDKPMDFSDSIAGKAWQDVEAVPEPFSGTLALLGMGVVALRRKMKKAKK